MLDSNLIMMKHRVGEKLRWIMMATKQHAWNLARFTAIYKFSRLFLRTLCQHEQGWHSFAAGALGGYLIFSKEDSVNGQIILYLLARVISGLVMLAYEKSGAAEYPILRSVHDHAFQIKASLCWGLVMWLFTYHRSKLQNSLVSSMVYLYEDSDHWNDLVDFFMVNKRKEE